MMTTTLSIDAGIVPVGGGAAMGVPMEASLAENALTGLAFEAAVAAFQSAMAAPLAENAASPVAVGTQETHGTHGTHETHEMTMVGRDVPIAPASVKTPATPEKVVAAEVPVATPEKVVAAEVPVATPETLKAVVAENVRIAAELPKATAVPVATPEKVVMAEVPVATPETMKAVVAENVRIAAELPKATAVPVVTPEKVVMAEDPVATTEAPVLQAAPMTVPVESTAVQQVVADVKVAALDAASARTQILVDAVEAVCDAILVTPGLVRGQGEMLIRLKPDVLAGTEVRLEAKGQTLTVAFIPATTEVSTLIERNLVQFQQHLSGRIHNYQIVARVNVDEKKLRS